MRALLVIIVLTHFGYPQTESDPFAHVPTEFRDTIRTAIFRSIQAEQKHDWQQIYSNLPERMKEHVTLEQFKALIENRHLGTLREFELQDVSCSDLSDSKGANCVANGCAQFGPRWSGDRLMAYQDIEVANGQIHVSALIPITLIDGPPVTCKMSKRHK